MDSNRRLNNVADNRISAIETQMVVRELEQLTVNGFDDDDDGLDTPC